MEERISLLREEISILTGELSARVEGVRRRVVLTVGSSFSRREMLAESKGGRLNLE